MTWFYQFSISFSGNIGRGGEKSEDILKLVLEEYANIRSV
jgi:hypothetical protein